MRLFLLIIILVLVGWTGYILFKNKSRFMSKYAGTETVTQNDDAETLRRQLAELQGKYDYLLQLCSSDTTTTNTAVPVQQTTDTLTESLSLQISELRAENLELRRELDQRKSTVKPKSNTTNPKKNNEKNIPIARNSGAVELQKFLTELYGDR